MSGSSFFDQFLDAVDNDQALFAEMDSDPANHFPGSFSDCELFPAPHDSLAGSGVYNGESAVADLTNMAAAPQLPSPDATHIVHVDPAAVQAECATPGTSIFAASARLAAAELRRSMRVSVATFETPVPAPAPEMTIEALVASWTSQTGSVVDAIEQLSEQHEKHTAACEFVALVSTFFTTIVAPLSARYGSPVAQPSQLELYEEEVIAEGQSFPALVAAAVACEPVATSPVPVASPNRKRAIEEANAPVSADLQCAEYVVPVFSGFTECDIAESRLAKLFSAEYVVPVFSGFTEHYLPAAVSDLGNLVDMFANCMPTPAAPMQCDDDDDDKPLVIFGQSSKRHCRNPLSVASDDDEVVVASAVQPKPVPAIRPVIDLDLDHSAIVGPARVQHSPSSAFRRTGAARIRAVITLPVTVSMVAQHYSAEQVSRALRFVINTPSGLTNVPASLRNLAAMASTRTAKITIKLDSSESSTLAWPIICEFVELVQARCPRLLVEIQCARLPHSSARRLTGVVNLSLVRVPGFNSYGSITELVDTRSVVTLQLDGHISPSALSAHDSSRPGLSYRSSSRDRGTSVDTSIQLGAEHPLRSLTQVTIKTSVPEGYSVEQVVEQYPMGMRTFMSFDPIVRAKVLLITPDCSNKDFGKDVAQHIVELPCARTVAVRISSAATASVVARAVCVVLTSFNCEERWAARLYRIELSNPANSTSVRFTIVSPTVKTAPEKIAAMIDSAFP